MKYLIKSRELDFVRNFEYVFSAQQPFLNWTRLLDVGTGSAGGSTGNYSEALEIEAQICVNEIIGYGFAFPT